MIYLFKFSVNVDEYLASAQIDSLGAEPDNISRTPSQASLRTESSGGVSGILSFLSFLNFQTIQLFVCIVPVR